MSISSVSSAAPAQTIPEHVSSRQADFPPELRSELEQIEAIDHLVDAIQRHDGEANRNTRLIINGEPITMEAYIEREGLSSLLEGNGIDLPRGNEKRRPRVNKRRSRYRREFPEILSQLARGRSRDTVARAEQILDAHAARNGASPAVASHASLSPISTSAMRSPEQLRANAEYRFVADGPAPGLTSVSAEGFVALLNSNLGHTDRDVLRTRSGIEENLATSRRLGGQLEILQLLHARSTREDGIDNLAHETLELSDGREVDADVLIAESGLSEVLGLGASGATSLSTGTIQSAIDNVREQQSQATSSNELDMITLQQLMQDRGRQIQLVSRILNMLHETQNSVIQNFR